MADVYSSPITYINCTGQRLPVRTGNGLNNSLTGQYIEPAEPVEVTKKAGDWIYIKGNGIYDDGWVLTKSSTKTLMKLTTPIPNYTSDKTYNAEENAKTAQAKLNQSEVAVEALTVASSLIAGAVAAAKEESHRKLRTVDGLSEMAPYSSAKIYETLTLDDEEEDLPEDIKAVQKPIDLDKKGQTKKAMAELRRIGENDFIIQSDLPKEKRFGMFDRVGILDATAKTISTKEYVFFTTLRSSPSLVKNIVSYIHIPVPSST